MNTSPLGRLEKLTIREHWANEATDFTPWLATAENMALLSDVLGLELEVERQEHPVGPFRADILCSDSASDRKVLIENQLERTDHCHLGQLLTYAAGLDAVTIVWIAERFTEEHRAALDWLNRITGDGVDFFGIEIELWRIGDSLPAPKFNVVAKPNSWADAVKRIRDDGLSETNELYLEYWTAFCQHLESSGSTLRPPRPTPDAWVLFPVGRSTFSLSANVSRQRSSAYVQMIIYEPDRLLHYKALEAQRSEVDAALGSGFEWRENPDRKESHIRRSFDGFDLDDRKDWSRQHDLIRTTVERLHVVLSPRVRLIGGPNLSVGGPVA